MFPGTSHRLSVISNTKCCPTCWFFYWSWTQGPQRRASGAVLYCIMGRLSLLEFIVWGVCACATKCPQILTSQTHTGTFSTLPLTNIQKLKREPEYDFLWYTFKNLHTFSHTCLHQITADKPLFLKHMYTLRRPGCITFVSVRVSCTKTPPVGILFIYWVVNI